MRWVCSASLTCVSKQRQCHFGGFCVCACVRACVCVQARQTGAVNSPLSCFDTTVRDIAHVFRSVGFIPSFISLSLLPFISVDPSTFSASVVRRMIARAYRLPRQSPLNQWRERLLSDILFSACSVGRKTCAWSEMLVQSQDDQQLWRELCNNG